VRASFYLVQAYAVEINVTVLAGAVIVEEALETVETVETLEGSIRRTRPHAAINAYTVEVDVAAGISKKEEQKGVAFTASRIETIALPLLQACAGGALASRSSCWMGLARQACVYVAARAKREENLMTEVLFVIK